MMHFAYICRKLTCLCVIRLDFQHCILQHRMVTTKVHGFYCLLDAVQTTEMGYVLCHIILLLMQHYTAQYDLAGVQFF